MTDDTATTGPHDGADAELLGLIDRLAVLLERSDLTEIEVESGSTGLILRKPVADALPAGSGTATSAPATTAGAPAGPAGGSRGSARSGSAAPTPTC